MEILGTTYKVIIVKGLKDDENSPVHGWCDKEKKTISIDADEKGDDFVDTFIHEFCHAVFREAGMGQTSLHEDLEEIVVNQLAKCITKMFSLKPKEA